MSVHLESESPFIFNQNDCSFSSEYAYVHGAGRADRTAPSPRHVHARIAGAAHRTQHHIVALTRTETETYLQHRLQMAGAADLPYFEPNAIEAVFDAARGMPRQINRIAHYALLAAFLDKAQQVSAEHVEKACAESRL